jgi:hypothetical protein
MRIAAPTKEIYKEAGEFTNALEIALERDRYSPKEPEDNWLDLDDDDTDKIWLLKTQKRLACEEGCEPNEVDNRILMYAYLRHKYFNRFGHIILACEAMQDACADPSKDYLDFAPGTVFLHVENEQ